MPLFHHTLLSCLLSLLHCVTVPPHFTVTVTLCHCAGLSCHRYTVLFYHTLLSLLHCVTTLYCHCYTVPLFHYTILSPLHSSTTLYYHCYTVPPHFIVTVTLCHCSTTLYCHRYTVSLFYHTLLSLLNCAIVPPLFTITVTAHFQTVMNDPTVLCLENNYNRGEFRGLQSCTFDSKNNLQS